MIIGLTGYAQSGKDTVAKYLIENHGYRRIAFADSIRDLLYEADLELPFDPYQQLSIKMIVNKYGWDEAKVRYPELREALQGVGLAARKVFGDNFWVARAMLKINGFQDKCVITDVRFINEAEAIKQYDNAQLWRIKRDGVTAVNNHISETEMEHYKVDQILSNQGTLDDLKELVDKRIALV